jgi:lipoyl synthase
MSKTKQESPDYIQTSTAGSMALGFERGSFYRNAKLHCLNLLLTYAEGCRANCAFCGLGRERESRGLNQDKTFIRVAWPIYPTSKIVNALYSPAGNDIKRVCISMVTHPRAKQDTLDVANLLKPTLKDISVLIAPTLVDKPWLDELLATGVEKVGVAIDAATEELFSKLRGKGVHGPHSWNKYWALLQDAIDVFGKDNTSIHLMIGIGETERDAITIIQKVHDLGADTHLFSFFPEPGSLMEHEQQPGIGKYRRVQLARESIFRNNASMEMMTFNEAGQITDFGMTQEQLDALVDDGIAFLTQGCKDKGGFITCNRPYSNNTPFQAAKGELRNFPFAPDAQDIDLIKKQLGNYDDNSWVRTLDEVDDFLIDESP